MRRRHVTAVQHIPALTPVSTLFPRTRGISNKQGKQARAPHENTGHLNPSPRQCYSACWRRRCAHKKKRIQSAFDERAHQDSPVSPQIAARGAARCATQILESGSQAVARGAARCASKVLDVPSTSSSRWPCLRGGAGACFNSCYAACVCGTKLRRRPRQLFREQTCGGVLGAMACLTPARSATRSTVTFVSRDLYNFVFSTESRQADRGRTGASILLIIYNEHSKIFR